MTSSLLGLTGTSLALVKREEVLLGGTLKNLQDSLNIVNVQDLAGKARDYARSNPAKVLGGLSALVIGAGLLAKRGRQ